MRYEKGTISINPSRDVPLLQHVLRSSFITGTQLFEFLQLESLERSERAFHHRLHRLIKHGLIEKQRVMIHDRGPIYKLTTAGLSLLSDLVRGVVRRQERNRKRQRWVPPLAGN